MSRLIEQCFELEEWEFLWTQGPVLNLIRYVVNGLIKDLNRPSLLREIVKVEKVI